MGIVGVITDYLYLVCLFLIADLLYLRIPVN